MPLVEVHPMKLKKNRAEDLIISFFFILTVSASYKYCLNGRFKNLLLCTLNSVRN